MEQGWVLMGTGICFDSSGLAPTLSMRECRKFFMQLQWEVQSVRTHLSLRSRKVSAA